MDGEKQRLVMKISLAVACAGGAMGLYPFVAGHRGSNIYGYVVLGGFIAMIGLVTAKIYHTRSVVFDNVMKAPLFHWKFQRSERDRDEDFPDEICVSESGMLWGRELYPFATFHCALVDFRVELDPKPMLTVVYTSRDRVGRKRHNLCSPIPPECVKEAEDAAKILVAKYGLEKRAQNRRKSHRE